MIKKATKEEIDRFLDQHAGIKNVVRNGDDSINLFYIHNENIIAILSAFFRAIPAPLNGETECFINFIGVMNENFHNKGIGSALVQEAIKIAEENKTIQVRAYCDINNKPSHMLWLKNKFSISLVRMPDGSIVGSFVTYRIMGVS